MLIFETQEKGTIMSGTRELKKLILMIDEHRMNIGNAQFSFEMDSESRYMLQRFSATIPRLLPEAFARIRELFWKELPWIDRSSQVPELVSDYVWSIVYPLRRKDTCTEENFPEQIHSLHEQFLKELEVAPKIKPSIRATLAQQGGIAFAYEADQLVLYYQQKREREALERS